MVKTDYYAVEHITNYIKEVIPEVKIETVRVPKKITKIEVEPVERYFLWDIGKSYTILHILPICRRSRLRPGDSWRNRGLLFVLMLSIGQLRLKM